MVMRMSVVRGHVRMRGSVHAAGSGSWTWYSTHVAVAHVRTRVPVRTAHHVRIRSSAHMRRHSSRTAVHSGSTHHVRRWSARMMVRMMRVVHHIRMRGTKMGGLLRWQHLVHAHSGHWSGPVARWAAAHVLLVLHRNCVRDHLAHHGSVVVIAVVVIGAIGSGW